MRPWHSPARDSAGLPHPPSTLPPLQPEARQRVDLGMVLPALFSCWEIPAPHWAFSGSAPPSAGPTQAGRIDTVSRLLKACGVRGTLPGSCPGSSGCFPPGPPLLGTHPEPAAEHVEGALSGRRGGLRGLELGLETGTQDGRWAPPSPPPRGPGFRSFSRDSGSAPALSP